MPVATRIILFLVGEFEAKTTHFLSSEKASWKWFHIPDATLLQHQMIIHNKTTLLETDSYMAPENEWLEDDISFWGRADNWSLIRLDYPCNWRDR